MKRLIIAALLSMATAACGDVTSEAATAPVVVDQGESFAGEVPAPQDSPVLSFSGGASAPNDGTDVSFDLATIERLHREQWTVFEPFVDADVTFVGVPFDRILAEVGVPDGVTSATLTALDEYQVTIDIADLLSGDVLLVTRDDLPGVIGVDRGGPIRFVWRGDSEASTNPDLWIWSIRHVELR